MNNQNKNKKKLPIHTRWKNSFLLKALPNLYQAINNNMIHCINKKCFKASAQVKESFSCVVRKGVKEMVSSGKTLQ